MLCEIYLAVDLGQLLPSRVVQMQVRTLEILRIEKAAQRNVVNALQS